MRRTMRLFLCGCALLTAVSAQVHAEATESPAETTEAADTVAEDFGTEGNYRNITTDDMCSVLLDHPAFADFGHSILPPNFAGGSKETMAEHSIGEILKKVKWDGATEPIMNSLNELIDYQNEGKQVFFPYYTEEEIAADETKAQTGIVFFEGEKDAPFVVITPGGGYNWYTGMAEGYPIAYEFQQRGYNALVLIYRVRMAELSDFPNKIKYAMEDYVAGMRFIFDHIGENDLFPVSPNQYTVCGFSAGARLAALWGGDGTRSWYAEGKPQPQALLLQYGGTLSEEYGDFSDYQYEKCPPVYALTCKDDKTRPTEEIVEMIGFYENAGVETLLDVREDGGHGFGLGAGTDAEGWIENAITFWEKHQASN